MAIEPIARGHYTQMQMQENQLQLARERLAQEEAMQKRQLAAQRDARMGALQEAIGMAFLNTGLKTGLTAAETAIDKAFKNPYKDLTTGAMYKAGYGRFGAVPAPKNKETKSGTDTKTSVSPQATVQQNIAAPQAVVGSNRFNIDGSSDVIPDLTPVADLGKGFEDSLKISDQKWIDSLSEYKGDGLQGPTDKGALAALGGPPVANVSRPAQEAIDRMSPDKSAAADDLYGQAARRAVESRQQQIQAQAVAKPTSAPQPRAVPRGTLIVDRTPGQPTKTTPAQKEVIKKLVTGESTLDSLDGSPEQIEGQYSDLYPDVRAAKRRDYQRMIAAARLEAEKKYPPIRQLTKKQIEDLSADERFLYYQANAARNALVEADIKTQTAQLAASEQYAQIGRPTFSQVQTATAYAQRLSNRYNPRTESGQGLMIKKALNDGYWTTQTTYQNEMLTDASQAKKDAMYQRLSSREKAIVDEGGDVPITRKSTPQEVAFLLTQVNIDLLGKRSLRALAKKGGVNIIGNRPFIAISTVEPTSSAEGGGKTFDIYDMKHLRRMEGSDIGRYVASYETAKNTLRDINPERAKEWEGKQQRAQYLAKWLRNAQTIVSKNPKKLTDQFKTQVTAAAEELSGLVNAYSPIALQQPKTRGRIAQAQQQRQERKAEQTEETLAQLKNRLQTQNQNIANAEKAVRAAIPGRLTALKNAMDRAKGKVDQWSPKKFGRYTLADVKAYASAPTQFDAEGVYVSGYVPKRIANPKGSGASFVTEFANWAKSQSAALGSLQKEANSAAELYNDFKASVGTDPNNYNIDNLKGAGKSILDKINTLNTLKAKQGEIERAIKNKSAPGDQSSFTLDNKDQQIADTINSMNIGKAAKQMRMYRYLVQKYPNRSIPVPPAMTA